MFAYSIAAVFLLQLCFVVQSAPTSNLPQFVRDAGQQGVKDFQSILSNRGLTSEAREEQLNQWAQKYNKVDQLAKYKEASNAKRQAHDQRVNDVLGQLPEFKRQIDEILTDRSISKADLDTKINNFSQQHKRLALVLKYINKIVDDQSIPQQNTISTTESPMINL